MTQTLTDAQKIARNTAYIEDLEVRQALFKQFCPTFYYHKDETNFPINPEDYVKNVIEVKHEQYTKTPFDKLTEQEQKELSVINRFFWKDDKFNPDYKQYANEPDVLELTYPPEGKPAAAFLVFDEKRYGYAVGKKINVTGVAPKGHPKYKEGESSAPTAASIIPTKDGYFIQYDSFYSLNNAINGTQWLRNLVPSALADKLSDFGFHYGDSEGVGIHVKVDDQGNASLDSMQTFAHGSKGAREVLAKDCTFDKDGKLCVFVGIGGHPSYADNFIGRNKFFDLVGDKYQITPQKFVDVSKDLIEIAHPTPDTPKNPSEYKVEAANKILPAWAMFRKLGDSNPLSLDGVRTTDEVENHIKKDYQKYHPNLFLEKTWNKIKAFVHKLTGHKEELKPAPVTFNLEAAQALSDTSTKEPSKNITKDKGRWSEEVGTKDDRAKQSSADLTRT